MADRVEIAFRRVTRPLVPDGCRVLVAVSGGGDSIALLHLFHRVAPSWSLDLVVAHLDHALRLGSAEERRFVRDAARELGVPCVATRRPVSSLRRRDESPEEAARRVRRAFLIEAARDVGAARIATGHTLDDQAETVLMRLVRGAGPSAITGIAPRGPGPFVRPLLDLERRALRSYLARRDVAFLDDPSNDDLRAERNRVRHEVLPLIADRLNPRAALHLVRAAALLREDAAWIDGEALRCFEALSSGTAGGLRLDAAGFAALPAVLARRVARLALGAARIDGRRVTSRHVGALLDLAAGPNGRAIDLPGGASAGKSRGAVRIVPPSSARVRGCVSRARS